MVNRNLSEEILVSLWEDRREIKNLMGRYSNLVLLNRQNEIVSSFWSTRDDICLGLNNGFYSNRQSVINYYNAIYEGNILKAKVLQQNFPDKLSDKSPEEIYGIGVLKAAPASSCLIEIAEDRNTAKGLWHIQGTYADITVKGPLSYTLWGYYAVDYIKENEKWLLWHMRELYDIDFIAGQSWGKPEIDKYPDIEGFEALRDFKLPEPDVKCVLREYYHPLRPYTEVPRMPEPYKTFSETFSYGITDRQ